MCPGDHRPLVFLIRYGDAGRAVTLQLSVPAPEPGEEGGFLYGAGSRCPGPPGPSGLQTLGRGTPDPQQAGGVTRLRRPGGFLGEPVFRPEAGAGKGHSSSHPHCWLNRRAPAWVLGFTKRYAGGGGRKEWREEPGRARVHARGLTLVHARRLTLVHAGSRSCTHAGSRSCTHVIMHAQAPAHTSTCLYTHTCLLGDTDTHTRAHTLALTHDHVHTHPLTHQGGTGPQAKSGRGGDPLPGRPGLCLPPWWPPRRFQRGGCPPVEAAQRAHGWAGTVHGSLPGRCVKERPACVPNNVHCSPAA